MWRVSIALLLFCGCVEKEQPNVLFIAIDDLNDWVGPLSGNPQSMTPNMDRFAASAMNFTRNYCTSPGCNPSRSTMLMGVHTYNSGMYSNYQDWRKVPKFQETLTLPQYFKENGYYTAGAGKIFHYSQVSPDSWHDYYPSQKQNMPANYIPEGAPVNMPSFKYMYQAFDWAPIPVPDEETGDFKTVSYIASQLAEEHEKPFFLAAGIYRPHLPWYVPQQYFEKFPLDAVQLPDTIEGDTADLGKRAKEIISRGGNYHKHVVEAKQWKQAVQGYLASVAFADAMVGALLDSLANSDYADNTIVVLWSDHGWQLGEKKHWRKFALWENVIRTVLMIRVPEQVAGTQLVGQTSQLTSLLDIYPTLVELCDLETPSWLDGQSLVPLLNNPDEENKRAVITTYDFADYSVRQGPWHLIQYVDGSNELYNLEDDPNEWYNLANDGSHSSIIQELITQIPAQPTPLPESSLIPLMEHHIPPVKSKAFYYSDERKNWMKRFE